MFFIYRAPAHEGIYEYIERRLSSYRQPMEEDELAQATRELDVDFRSVLTERGIDITGLRLELRRDELLGVVPWVVHTNGLENTLSAFSAAARRNGQTDF